MELEEKGDEDDSSLSDDDDTDDEEDMVTSGRGEVLQEKEEVELDAKTDGPERNRKQGSLFVSRL